MPSTQLSGPRVPKNCARTQRARQLNTACLCYFTQGTDARLLYTRTSPTAEPFETSKPQVHVPRSASLNYHLKSHRVRPVAHLLRVQQAAAAHGVGRQVSDGRHARGGSEAVMRIEVRL